jgi:hypothetical protein
MFRKLVLAFAQAIASLFPPLVGQRPYTGPDTTYQRL